MDYKKLTQWGGAVALVIAVMLLVSMVGGDFSTAVILITLWLISPYVFTMGLSSRVTEGKTGLLSALSLNVICYAGIGFYFWQLAYSADAQGALMFLSISVLQNASLVLVLFILEVIKAKKGRVNKSR